MTYADPDKNKWIMKCYHKALGQLRKMFPKEFDKIFRKLMKGGKDGKNN